MKEEVIRWDKVQDRLFNFVIKPKGYGKSFHKYSKYSKEEFVKEMKNEKE